MTDGSSLHNLTIGQIVETVGTAAERHFPVDVSVWNGSWILLKSRLVGVENEHMFIEFPRGETGGLPDFTPAMKIGLAFKVRNHKYMCPVRVVGTTDRSTGDGDTQRCLELCYPTRMDRLQKRHYARVDIPEGSIVRVALWAGGKDDEPRQPEAGVVSIGRVRDISAGGLQAVLPPDTAPAFDEGMPIGCRITFGTGTGRDVVSVDAQVRCCGRVEEGFRLGMKFLGLEQTREGKERLGVILRNMKTFQVSG